MRHGDLQDVVSRWSDAFLTLLVNLPATLRQLPTRTPAISVWHWESFPIPDIPDTELRSRFSVPYGATEATTGLDWGNHMGSEYRVNSEDKLVLELSFLLTAVVLVWVCLMLSKCFCNVNHFAYNSSVKRVPVWISSNTTIRIDTALLLPATCKYAFTSCARPRVH